MAISVGRPLQSALDS